MSTPDPALTEQGQDIGPFTMQEVAAGFRDLADRVERRGAEMTPEAMNALALMTMAADQMMPQEPMQGQPAGMPSEDLEPRSAAMFMSAGGGGMGTPRPPYRRVRTNRG